MKKEEFLEQAGLLWDKIKEEEKTKSDFYSYEQSFDKKWVELGRQTLEGSMIEKETVDRRKKKPTE